MKVSHLQDAARTAGPGRDRRPRRVGSGLLALMVVAATMTGCSMMRPTHTGFLADYEQLAPTSRWWHRGLGTQHVDAKMPAPGEMAAVDSFVVEPIAWAFEEGDWLGPNADRRGRVVAALDASIRERLGQIRPIVATPGPRTARVRAAVTNIKSARPLVNAAVTVIPPIFGGAFWIVGPATNGGAAFEVEVRAPDGHTIAAVDGGSNGGYLDLLGYYSRSGHPKKAALRIARDLGDLLEAKASVRPDLPPLPLSR